MLQTQINTTIPRTNIISTIKQLIKVVSQFLQMCRNIIIKFISWAYMYMIEIIRRKPGRETQPDSQTDRDRDGETEIEAERQI